MKCRLKKFTYCCSILFFFGKKNIFYSENILHIIANGNGLYVNIFDGVFKTKKNMGVGGGGGASLSFFMEITKKSLLLMFRLVRDTLWYMFNTRKGWQNMNICLI